MSCQDDLNVDNKDSYCRWNAKRHWLFIYAVIILEMTHLCSTAPNWRKRVRFQSTLQ